MNFRGLAAGWIAFGLSNLALVLFVFGPVADLPGPDKPPVPAVVAFAIYITFIVVLFDWTANRIGSPWKAAAALGGAQFLLVNVDMVLRGERALETAIASTIMLFITWSALALAWQLAAQRRDQD